MSPERPLALSLEDPAPLLRWLTGTGPEPAQLELLILARTWVRAALGAAIQDPKVEAVFDRALNLLQQMNRGENPDAVARLFPAGSRVDSNRFRRQRVTG